MESLRESQYSQDLLQICLDDVKEGAMTAPRQVSQGGVICWNEVGDKFLTRRLAVREERAHGWRTRTVDDFSYCDINEACVPVDSPIPDSVDCMIAMLVFLLSLGISPTM